MKEVGKSTIKVLLAIINAYYDETNGYSHCSVAEINKKYGMAKNSIPKMFQQLCDEGWIEDCTVNDFDVNLPEEFILKAKTHSPSPITFVKSIFLAILFLKPDL